MSFKKWSALYVVTVGSATLGYYARREEFDFFAFLLLVLLLLAIASQIEGFIHWQKKRLEEIEDGIDGNLRNIAERLEKIEDAANQ